MFKPNSAFSPIKIMLVAGLLLLLNTAGHPETEAQVIPPPLAIAASPETPGPGEKFTVSAATPTMDKNLVFFSWTLNGVQRTDLSGPGKNIIDLTAGEVGTMIRVGVTVSGPQGSESSSLAIHTADLVLSWHADTYVPRWYKGKALPVQNSVVNVVAIPRISGVRADQLIYQWEVDDDDDALNGIGTNVFSFRTSVLPGSSHHVRITVNDPIKGIKKRGALFIVPSTPSVFIYPVTPLGGIEPRSAPPLFFANPRSQIDFAAEPFYFSISSKSELPYSWTIAGQSAASEANSPYFLSVNTGDNPVGSVPLSVSVKSPENFIAVVAKTINLIFP